MKFHHLVALCAAGLLAAPFATAQPASAPGAAASAPRGPMGMGAGRGAGMGGRFGAGVTPGWQMMTPEERAAHQQAMRNAKTYDECAAVRDKHHEEMAARAKDKGVAMPAAPRRDVCAGLKK